MYDILNNLYTNLNYEENENDKQFCIDIILLH